MLDTNEVLSHAHAVMRDEAGAILEADKRLDDSFVKAVDLILNCKGRLVLSGIGKSGHIATKLAATFASTGTPAYFVHAAEAAHGDLGMITKIATSSTKPAPSIWRRPIPRRSRWPSATRWRFPVLLHATLRATTLPAAIRAVRSVADFLFTSKT